MLSLDSLVRSWDGQITVKTSGLRRQCDDDALAVPLVLLFLAYSPTSRFNIPVSLLTIVRGERRGKDNSMLIYAHAQTVLTA